MKVSGHRLAWILLGSLIAVGYQPVFCEPGRSNLRKDDTLSISLDELTVAEDLDSAEVDVHTREETPTFPIRSEDQQKENNERRSDFQASWLPMAYRAKRQQGWHTKYGKRQQGWHTKYGKRQQGWHTKYGKRQQGWHTKYGKRQQGWHTKYGKRQLHRDQPDSYFYDDINDNDFKRLALDKTKRQGGWYTQYGKRSENFETPSEGLLTHRNKFDVEEYALDYISKPKINDRGDSGSR